MNIVAVVKRSSAVLVSIVVAVSSLMVLVAVPAAHAAPGDSVEDPILITDCTELQLIDSNTENYSKHYALDNDIDCADSASWNEGKGFDPIGSNDNAFTGTFNGRHHTITNLTINRANDTPGLQGEDDEESVGLFAWAANATIQNLNIDTSKVKGFAYVGGIVGWSEDTILTNVSFNASVADNDCDPGYCVWARYGFDGGGIVGMLDGGSITNGVTAGPVKGSGNTIGGLVGNMGNNSSITSSSSSSNIDGGNSLGGAVGYMGGGTLEDVHASGSIDANADEDLKSGEFAGGLVGRVEGTASISRSEATGDVVADFSAAGGLVGYKTGSGSIVNSYARGNVLQTGGWTQGGAVGGLIGELRGGAVERSYASGNVTGEYSIGGLAGFTTEDNNVAIRNSFATGLVTQTGPDSEARDGGLIGYYNWGIELDNNYYDATRTGMDHCLAGYPEVYWESPTTIDGEDSGYFYDQLNQPFDDGEVPIWSSSVWDFHEDDYPTFDCEQCEVIEDDEPEAAATLETLGAEDITATSAIMHGEAQLHNGLTIDDVGHEGSILVGFHLNTNPTVDWEHNSHSAAVDDVTTIDDDDTHIAFSGEITGLECETQYWYVAAYEHLFEGGNQLGMADNVETFTTADCPTDTDNDGILNDVEDAAPNGGDANNDDIQDSLQGNVASFVNTVTSQYTTVVVDEQCQLSSVSANKEENNWAQDNAYTYNAGLVSFTADCGEDGFTTPVTLYFYGVDSSETVVRKYNPNTQTYTTITDASITQQSIDDQNVTIVSYEVTDGGELDIDGEENGIIVDPVGLASPVAPEDQTSNASNARSDLANTGQSTMLLYFVASIFLLTAAGIFVKIKQGKNA